MLTILPFAFANALPNPLICNEEGSSYASRQIVLEYMEDRGEIKVFDYDGITVTNEFSVGIEYEDGYIPTVHIQNWDWFPRFDMNLGLLPDLIEGNVSIVDENGEDQFNVTCNL